MIRGPNETLQDLALRLVRLPKERQVNAIRQARLEMAWFDAADFNRCLRDAREAAQ